jgi:uncharacterized protein (TIGR00369 family)
MEMALMAKESDAAARVRANFEAQSLMRTLNASLRAVAPGHVEIHMPNGDHIRQQHGFVHAAALTAIVDTACGFAAQSLMAPDQEVLTIEFKMNFMAPATAPEFLAVGKVKRPGRQVHVVEGEVFGLLPNGARKSICVMLATMIAVAPQKAS